MEGRWTLVPLVPDEPGEGDGGGGLVPLPAIPVHHWEAVSKYVDTSQMACIKDGSSPLGLNKGKPEKHAYPGAKRYGPDHKLFCQAVRGIGDNSLVGLAGDGSGHSGGEEEVDQGPVLLARSSIIV